MPFFIRKGKKRKHQNSSSTIQKVAKLKKDEDIDDSDIETDSNEEETNNAICTDEEDATLTAQEKKVKLAKKYLKDVEEEEKKKLLDDSADVQANVLKRLTEDELQKSGKLKRTIADHMKLRLDEQVQLKSKLHKLSITCLVVSYDSNCLYSASKDSSIIKWSLENNMKVISVSPKLGKNCKNKFTDEHLHRAAINCLAISYDNKFLVSGDEKGIINVWNPNNLNFIHTFKGHKMSVTGLAICKETNYLYSSSYDSSVKVWTLNELSYTETLFGHQANTTFVDILYKDRVITSGGSDCTLRLWKIQEESQLLYNGHQGESIDMVKRIDNGHFVSCGDHGIISVWSILKKKPISFVNNAHGICEMNGSPNWISCICPFPNSDLIASGSCDGYIRLWKCSSNYTSLTPLNSIPVVGFINSIAFTQDEKFIIIAAAKEHRFGRWFSLKEAKNNIIRIPMDIVVNSENI